MEKWDRSDLSPALLLAQQKLNSLREHHRAQALPADPRSVSVGREQRNPTAGTNQQRSLPAHLGWGSIPLTKAFRKAQGQQKRSSRRGLGNDLDLLESGCQGKSHQQPISDPKSDRSQVKLYPDLALGMLGRKVVAEGRIWLLLQHLDGEGRGWISGEDARERLTEKNSDLRLCGRRQLRKLLDRGDGTFWIRNKNRIWLRSAAKVAASLGVTHLHGRPVGLSTTVLLAGIGAVRAHFYASFHSGRKGKHCDRSGKIGAGSRPDPLSRATLQMLSKVSPRTQRYYEKRASVQRQPNYVITRQTTKVDIQEQAWRRGRAWFRFTDHTGKFGEKGLICSAWQLPNSYWGPHEQKPIGRQKRINQELADLFMKGMTGNGKSLQQDETPCPVNHVRRFHNCGSAAAVSYNRQPKGDVFWRSRVRHAGDFEMWHYLPGQGSS